MRNFFLTLLLILSFNFYQPVISPTTAQIEPVVLENVNYLNHQAVVKTPKFKKEYWVTITAYSSDPEETDDTPYITASGKWVEDGVAASNFLPLGTKIKIPELFGDKIFTINDRMNNRFNDRIDIWVPTKWEAIQFGKKEGIRVIVLPQ